MKRNALMLTRLLRAQHPAGVHLVQFTVEVAGAAVLS